MSKKRKDKENKEKQRIKRKDKEERVEEKEKEKQNEKEKREEITSGTTPTRILFGIKFFRKKMKRKQEKAAQTDVFKTDE